MKPSTLTLLLTGLALTPCSVGATNATPNNIIAVDLIAARATASRVVQITEPQLLSIAFDTLEQFKETLDSVLSEAFSQDSYVLAMTGLSVSTATDSARQSGAPSDQSSSSSEGPQTFEAIYDSYLRASTESTFDAVSFKREMLLAIGATYDLQILFSAHATDPSADRGNAQGKLAEQNDFMLPAVGALAGTGLFLVSSRGSSTPAVDTTFMGMTPEFTYSEVRASSFTGSKEYQNVGKYPTDSAIHPYTLIGVDYAYGLGLSGEGKVVAVNDYQWADDDNPLGTILEFSNKEINSSGSLSKGSSETFDLDKAAKALTDPDYEYRPVSFHGVHVAGTVAANFNEDPDNFDPDGIYSSAYAGQNVPDLKYGMMGVAYNADLLITDFTNRVDESTIKGNAENFRAAKEANAIAINNSWCLADCGPDNLTIEKFVDYKTDQNATAAEALAALDLATYSADHYQAFLDEMISYQQVGVIVFITGNDDTAEEPKVLGGLPVLVPELAEAWLAVGNLDVTGTPDVNGQIVSDASVTRYSNPCGSAAEFCVYADGTHITSTVGGFDEKTGDAYYFVDSGSSMAAPQASGAIALLSQAFPNHTPAQLVDRILASANNDFFVATGTTAFANGVTHGYNTEFGHGIINLEAALKPIGSSSMIPANGGSSSIYRASRFSFGLSSIDLGYSFGDSLSQALNGQPAFFYDGLNGGFAFDAGRLINQPKWTPAILLAPTGLKVVGDQSVQFGLAYSGEAGQQQFKDAAFSITRSISKKSKLSFGAKVSPQTWALGLSDLTDGTTVDEAYEFKIPFVQSAEYGRYAGADTMLANSRIAVSSFSGVSSGNKVSSHGLLLATTSTFGDSKFSAFAGTTFENAGLLDSSINGAFAETSDSVTQFAGVAARGKVSRRWGFEAMASLGFSRLDVGGTGMLKDIDNVTSSAFAFEAIRPLDRTTSVHFGLSQPLRVESGEASIELPLMYDSDGLISSHTVQTDLSPSGRQLDFKAGIKKGLGRAGQLSVMGVLSKDAGHVQQSGLTPSALLSWSVTL